MAVDTKISQRAKQLIDDGNALIALANRDGQLTDLSGRAQCSAWLTAAENLIQQLCEGSPTPYLEKAKRIAGERVGYLVHERVAELSALLRRVVADASAGLITSAADRGSGEAFTTFLDHGQAYLKQKRKAESGAIVGVVFEDSIRRICQKYNISEKDVSIDQLISTLTSHERISPAKAKRARAAAHVRTKATHAQWDEFDLDDVEAAIDLTRELIALHLDV